MKFVQGRGAETRIDRASDPLVLTQTAAKAKAGRGLEAILIGRGLIQGHGTGLDIALTAEAITGRPPVHPSPTGQQPRPHLARGLGIGPDHLGLPPGAAIPGEDAV